jgi:pentose-5-phosphate-3-epimerase
MKASVSLWSAELLAAGHAVVVLDLHVDGFHMDVMDGHLVPELLFGVDTVRAVSTYRGPRSLMAGRSNWVLVSVPRFNLAP